MSDCGGITIAALAAPLVLVVLLVAGVTMAALRGAQVVAGLAIQAIDFAGSKLVEGVKSATSALQGVAGQAIESLGRNLASTASTLTTLRTTATNLLATKQAELSASATQVGGAMRQRAVTALARVAALREALQSNQTLCLVAEAHAPISLARANSLIVEATNELAIGNNAAAQSLSAEAESLLADAAKASHDRLAISERAVVTVQAGSVLTEMGYEVRAAHDSLGVGLVGRKSDKVVAVAIGSGGKVDFDMSGFVGSECEGEADRLINGLKQNGVGIAPRSRKRHGCIAGGPLIQRAARQSLPLEEALARMGDELSRSDDLVRRSVTIGEQETSTSVAWIWGRQLQQSRGKR